MCCGKLDIYCIDKEGNKKRNGAGSVEVFLDKTVGSMKLASFGITQHMLCRQFSARSSDRKLFAMNIHLWDFNLAEYKEDYSTVQGVHEQENSENVNISETSALTHSDNSLERRQF